ncbi:MAG: Uma2 family endonuclease [Anaerolineae bacterium]|nr:Uma2 family endonuclease [Candidatus Roseilinea sp.]MDW8450522.1 Uma2 family endonuclease [Anaerolineae bacterium]
MSAVTPTRDGRRPIAHLRMTYEQFLAWSDEDTHAEWVDGEVIQFMPPKLLHQAVANFLANLLSLFVEMLGLGRIISAPFEVRLSDHSSREPDIFFVSNDRLDRLTDERMDGAPDLIVEIVSKESVQRDTEDKFREYEAAGVREYWIIDNRPRRRRAEFYALDSNGKYQLIPVTKDGVFRSIVLPGFWLRTSWLWQERPDVLRALAEVIGPDQVAEALRRSLGQRRLSRQS